MERLPFTEQTNPLSAALDGSLSAEQFLSTLRACDGQIFSGFAEETCMLDDIIVEEIDRTAKSCASLIAESKNAKIVMTGCGTSGRIAFLTARRYNLLLKEAGCNRSPFAYACAGGDSALLLSDELPEDDAAQGVADVDKASNSSTHTMIIGVTCGISAPYVAGQMAHMLYRQLNDDNCAGSACVMGFNPLNLARDSNIIGLPVGWRSFRDVAAAMGENKGKRCTVLNPVLGAEPIAGSSRMKGGSATLIMLDIICMRTLFLAGLLPTTHYMHSLCSKSVLEIMCEYQRVHAVTYSVAKKPAALIMQNAACALKAGGRVYYIGADSAAVVGGIDLSEMPDTYGAPFDQMRAFIHNGWEAFGNVDGDISYGSHLRRIGLNHFESDILPSLTANDHIVCLPSACKPTDDYSVAELYRIMRLVDAKHKECMSCVFVTNNDVQLDPANRSIVDNMKMMCGLRLVEVELPLFHTGLADFAIKIVLNAVSTYAQAAGRGAVFKSLMISTGPANAKIYDRCIRLIADTVNVSMEQSTVALLKSIYSLDCIDSELLHAPKIKHIQASLLPQERRGETQIILPVSFLLAHQPGMSVVDARLQATAQPDICVLLRNVLVNTPKKSEDRNVPCDASRVVATSTRITSSAILSSSAEEYYIGIDLGGTNIRGAAVCACTGRFLGEVVQICVVDRSPESILSYLSQLVRSIQCNCPRKLVAIGIGQPGFVCQDGSIKCLANYSNWGLESVPVKAHIVEASGCECVYIYDDADSALAGEMKFGAGKLHRSAVMFTVGTGIGVSAVLSPDGTVYHGSRGLIEAGHAIVDGRADSSAPICSCGQVGCLEMLASGTAIARIAAQKGVSYEGCSSDELTSEMVVLSSESGNLVAEKVLEDAAYFLAVGILNAIRHYDPSVVLLGGGMGNVMHSRVCNILPQLIWKLHPDLADIPICVSRCEHPGILGAVALAVGDSQKVCEGAPPKTLKNVPYLRKARENDRLSLYRVCLVTGDAGNDATALYRDQQLLGAIYVGPYLSHAIEFAFALDDGTGRCVGYTLGVLDTAEFTLTSRRYFHSLREIYPSCTIEHSSYLPREQELINRELYKQTETSKYSAYPSHLHIDITEQYQGQGYGAILIHRQLNALRAAGSIGVHLVQDKNNDRAFMFYTKKFNFEIIDRLSDELVLGLRLV